MYNRYIPRSDGSFTRNRMPEPPPPRPQAQEKPPASNHCDMPNSPSPPPMEMPLRRDNKGFLQQLLPKNFDTGDLIVILLLLLMAGDSPEERNSAILTIALYFLM